MKKSKNNPTSNMTIIYAKRMMMQEQIKSKGRKYLFTAQNQHQFNPLRKLSPFLQFKNGAHKLRKTDLEWITGDLPFLIDHL